VGYYKLFDSCLIFTDKEILKLLTMFFIQTSRTIKIIFLIYFNLINIACL